MSFQEDLKEKIRFFIIWNDFSCKKIPIENNWSKSKSQFKIKDNQIINPSHSMHNFHFRYHITLKGKSTTFITRSSVWGGYVWLMTSTISTRPLATTTTTMNRPPPLMVTTYRALKCTCFYAIWSQPGGVGGKAKLIKLKPPAAKLLLIAKAPLFMCSPVVIVVINVGQSVPSGVGTTWILALSSVTIMMMFRGLQDLRRGSWFQVIIMFKDEKDFFS